MYFIKRLLAYQQDIFTVHNYHSEFRRLLLLENAVRYYGGGLAQLEARVSQRAVTLRALDPLTATLLDDVARYLHDVALAGALSCNGRGE